MGLPIRNLPNHEWEEPRKVVERPALRLVENLPAPRFAPIEREPNWRSLGTSTLVHVSGVIVLILIPLFITDQISLTRRYQTIDLMKPKPVKPYQPPAPKVKLPPPPPLPRLRACPLTPFAVRAPPVSAPLFCGVVLSRILEPPVSSNFQ